MVSVAETVWFKRPVPCGRGMCHQSIDCHSHYSYATLPSPR